MLLIHRKSIARGTGEVNAGDAAGLGSSGEASGALGCEMSPSEQGGDKRDLAVPEWEL